MLEQAARNQQGILKVQMELMDQSRGQYQVQLQELKERHAAEKQHWEDRSRAEVEARDLCFGLSGRESVTSVRRDCANRSKRRGRKQCFKCFKQAALAVQTAELRVAELQAAVP